MNDHPLPWAVIQTDHDKPAYIVDVEGNQVVRMTAPQGDAARHIVACVNACKGCSTDALAVLPIGFIHSWMAATSALTFTESEGGEA